MNKEDSDKPIFSLTNLKITRPRSPEDIRRAKAQGRFAEMTPDLAGDTLRFPSIVRPVVFLDMDDVLCLSDRFGSREMLKIIQREVPDRPELWAGLVDVEAAINLYELHQQFMPSYVISSSWATYLDHEQMCQALTRTNLEFVVDNLHAEWRTPRARSSSRRDEIEWWLDAHREAAQPFLVIDDSYSGTGLAHSPLALNGHVVLCRSGYGFTKKRLKEARYQLQRQQKDET